jgi:hypothetical protein
MAEAIVVEQKGDSSFWSPWVVLLLGTPFAFLNWWRMKKWGKAVFFLVTNIFANLLISWTEYKGGITPTDHALSTQIIFARLFIHIAFAGLLALMISVDIQRFKEEGRAPASVKWQVIFVFWAILVIANLGIWVALDYGAREIGICRFPRFQDVIYQKEFEQRTGLATLVLGRNDFNCDWIWDIEVVEPFHENGYYLYLVGDLNNKQKSSFWASELIFEYEKVTTENFSEIVQGFTGLDGSEYLVKVEDLNARYSKVECARYSDFTICNLILGYQNVISRLELTFSGLSDEQINELIQSVVSTNSQRIQAYEEK